MCFMCELALEARLVKQKFSVNISVKLFIDINHQSPPKDRGILGALVYPRLCYVLDELDT